MKTKIILVLSYIIILCVFGIMHSRNKKIKDDRDRLKSNQETLLKENETYKTKLGLYAVKTSDLEFTLSEFKKYRKDDYDVIQKLNLEKKGLQSMISTNMETINSLQLALKDSTIIKDTILKTEIAVKSFEYNSKWIDIKGYVGDSLYIEHIKNRERLKIAMHKVPKKFLFIKLPISIFGFKDNQLDIISLNPNTKIDSVEYINIK